MTLTRALLVEDEKDSMIGGDLRESSRSQIKKVNIQYKQIYQHRTLNIFVFISLQAFNKSVMIIMNLNPKHN